MTLRAGEGETKEKAGIVHMYIGTDLLGEMCSFSLGKGPMAPMLTDLPPRPASRQTLASGQCVPWENHPLP